MGGAVLFGVRSKEGQEIITDHWTNTLKERMWKWGRENLYSELLKVASPENEWPRTKLITEIEPIEYGYVLADCLTGDVLSCQGYTTIDQMEAYGFTSSNDVEEFFEKVGKPKTVLESSVLTDEESVPVTKRNILSRLRKGAMPRGKRWIVGTDQWHVIKQKERDYDRASVVKWCAEHGWKSPISKTGWENEE